MPDMPMPPMPTKWMGPIWLGSLMAPTSPARPDGADSTSGRE